MARAANVAEKPRDSDDAMMTSARSPFRLSESHLPEFQFRFSRSADSSRWHFIGSRTQDLGRPFRFTFHSGLNPRPLAFHWESNPGPWGDLSDFENHQPDFMGSEPKTSWHPVRRDDLISARRAHDLVRAASSTFLITKQLWNPFLDLQPLKMASKVFDSASAGNPHRRNRGARARLPRCFLGFATRCRARRAARCVLRDDL